MEEESLSVAVADVLSDAEELETEGDLGSRGSFIGRENIGLQISLYFPRNSLGNHIVLTPSCIGKLRNQSSCGICHKTSQ